MRAYQKQEGFGQSFILGESKALEVFIDQAKAKQLANAAAAQAKAKGSSEDFTTLRDSFKDITDKGFYEAHTEELRSKMSDLETNYLQIVEEEGGSPMRSNSESAKKWRAEYDKLRFGAQYSLQLKESYDNYIDDAAQKGAKVDMDALKEKRSDLGQSIWSLMDAQYTIGEPRVISPTFDVATFISDQAKAYKEAGGKMEDKTAWANFVKGNAEVKMAQNDPVARAYAQISDQFGGISFVEYAERAAMGIGTYSRGATVKDIASQVGISKSSVEKGGKQIAVSRVKDSDIKTSIISQLKGNPEMLKKEWERLELDPNLSEKAAMEAIAKDMMPDVKAFTDSNYGESVTNQTADEKRQMEESFDVWYSDITGRKIAPPGANVKEFRLNQAINAASRVTKVEGMQVVDIHILGRESSLGTSIGMRGEGTDLPTAILREGEIAFEVKDDSTTTEVEMATGTRTTTKGNRKFFIVDLEETPKEYLKELFAKSDLTNKKYEYEAYGTNNQQPVQNADALNVFDE